MALGDLIGGGIGAAISGVAGYFAQKKAAKAQKQANKIAYEREKEFAQNQIQWKVKDAVAAGLHPLAGLGVNPASANASAEVGGDPGGWVRDMGSNLGRAAEAALSTQDKTQVQVAQLQVQRAQLENELVRSQIASERMRNVFQSATNGAPREAAGVQLGGPGEMPLPEWLGGGKMPIKYSTGGDAAESWAGDGLGDAWSTGFAVDDILRYRAVERLLTDPVGTAAAWAIDKTKKMQAGPRAPARSGFKARYLGGR